MSERAPYRLYTAEEDAIIIDGYLAKTGPKVISRQLEDRSQASVQKRAKVLGFTNKGLAPHGSNASWVPGEMARVLDDGVLMTPAEIAAVVNASLAQVYAVLSDGHGTAFHIAGWVARGKMWAARWTAGPGKDVPNDQKKTVREYARIRQNRARRRAKFDPFETLIHQVTA